MPTDPAHEPPSSTHELVASGIGLAAAAIAPVAAGRGIGDAGDRAREVRLRINGADRALRVAPEVTLLDALRDHLHLTGTKRGCNLGQCGACTVLLDGKRVNACLVLAQRADGREVVTIEGLAGEGGRLHPVQQAFIDQDAFQCGYCTPGQIMSAVALIAEGRANDPDELRRHMSGNLCRCGAHANIIAAIRQAAEQMRAGG